MYDDEWVPYILVGVAMVALIACIAAMIKDESDWDKFRVQHECRLVGKISGDVFNTIGFSGNGQLSVGIGSTPGKKGYACNDGMTYWR